MGGQRGTRQRLLDAAVAAIDAGGEDAVRVRAVSAEAGVSYASLYHFFGTRAALLDEAQAERFRRGLDEFLQHFTHQTRACRTKREFRALLRRSLEWLFEPERIAQRWVRTHVLGVAASRPGLAERIAEVQRRYHAELAEAFRPAQERGWIRADLDLDMFTAWTHGVVNGRLLIELDEETAGSTAWNRLAVEGVLAVALGESPRGASGR